MELSRIVTYALSESAQLKVNEVFMLRDLFKSYEWDRLDISTRQRAGVAFLSIIEKSGHKYGIKSLGRKSNKLKYCKYDTGSKRNLLLEVKDIKEAILLAERSNKKVHSMV